MTPGLTLSTPSLSFSGLTLKWTKVSSKSNIKAFWGEDIYDNALINLSPILITIAKEGGDIRKGLAKYRDEIVEKVTSNISKHNI